MMHLLYEIQSQDWKTPYSEQMQSQAVDALESGKIILFPHLSFELSPAETVFLSTEYSLPKFKNISYNINKDIVRGANCKGHLYETLKGMMTRYAQSAHGMINQLFPSYGSTIEVGRTSFRPIEIMGRVPKSFRKDDTRLHVDAFPMSPTQGKRIFRVFTNINPEGKDRIWRVGDSFHNVATHFLPKVHKPWFGRSFILNTLGLTKCYCTEYDYIMLQFHDQMKADLGYQNEVLQHEIRFKPHSTWIVQTDSVSHAAMSGQFVLEQTFYLPVNGMVHPELSPLHTLEKLAGRALV